MMHVIRVIAVGVLNDTAIRRIDSQVSGAARVFDHPAFDVIAFVTKRNNEFGEVVRPVMHHDVPQNWLTADFDHRFWIALSFL